MPHGLNIPYVLKASSCVDINATGALNEFALLRRNPELANVDMRSMDELKVVFEEVEIFTTDLNAWVPFTREIYDALYRYVESVENGQPSAEFVFKEDDDEHNRYVSTVSSVLLNASTYGLYRETIKGQKNNCEDVILLSLVIGENNVEHLIQQHGDDKKLSRVVKLMKKSLEVGDTCLSIYTRLTAQRGPSIAAQPVMFHISRENGDFIVATKTHVMIRHRGYYKPPQPTKNFNEALQVAEDGINNATASMVMDTKELDRLIADTIIKTLDVKVPTDEDEYIGDEFETPVAILYSDKAPLELLRNCKDCTKEAIKESKEEAPTLLHSAARLCDETGSAFKYARSVSMALLQKPSRGITARVGEKVFGTPAPTFRIVRLESSARGLQH